MRCTLVGSSWWRLPTSGRGLGPGSSSSERVGAALARSAFQGRDVDENGPVAFHGGTRGETLRPAVAPAGVEREPPAMVAANEPVAFDFALAQKRALMRAEALEGAPPGACSYERDIDAARRQSEGTVADEIARIGRCERRGRASCNLLQLEPARLPGGGSDMQLDMRHLDRLSCGRESEILSLAAVLGKTVGFASARRVPQACA